MIMTTLAQLGRRLRPGSRAAPAALDGVITELSALHVAGWLRDLADPGRRPSYEVFSRRTGQVLSAGVADLYRYQLHWMTIGDGAHGFHARLPAGADPADIGVRAMGHSAAFPRWHKCTDAFEPLLHVAMDIVDNCNLRCPFCIYDYTGVRATNLMTQRTLERALTLLPYTRDGQFWFSCLHEPTLHPELMAFIERVPAGLRRKLFYTTNLAKRMPDGYFDWLANSGLYNLNISIESRDPAIYERMRKGARHRIFQDNWEKLLAAFARAPAPPRLRYIAMAYKSNVDELPELARFLLEECQAWQVELRYTYDAPWIPAAFRQAEFLDAADWVRLRASLPVYPHDVLLLIAPPDAPVPDASEAAPVAEAVPPPANLADYYKLRVTWDGTVQVAGISPASRDNQAIEQPMLTTTLDAIGDPLAFIDSLSAASA